MTFQLVYYSQQDPKWKKDILGFGDRGDTIGYVGCALTSVAMLLSGHGFIETPKTLNQKLQNVNGFASAGIRWGSVSQIHPQVNMKSFISCASTDAPLAQIDASIAAGQPVIVMVDSTPAAGLSTHWVVLYAREGKDYLMLDPWPYQTDITKKDYLMPRYSQGNPLKHSIMHVIIYEAYNASGGIAAPGSSSATGTLQTQPTTGSISTSSFPARVKADVAWGLNIRSSTDTSSQNNIIVSVPAGTLLSVLNADDYAKIGGVNQWPNGIDYHPRRTTLGDMVVELDNDFLEIVFRTNIAHPRSDQSRGVQDQQILQLDMWGQVPAQRHRLVHQVGGFFVDGDVERFFAVFQSLMEKLQRENGLAGAGLAKR
jgi:hypothetical protein